MKKRNCLQCQGDQVEAPCVNIDHEEFDTLDEFIEDSSKKLEELTESPDIDIKDLTEDTKSLSRDEILQLLIDNVSILKDRKDPELLENCVLDWTPIENCNDCSHTFCEKFQILINKVGLLLEKNDIW